MLLVALEVFKISASLDLSLGYISWVPLVFPKHEHYNHDCES